MSRYIHLVFSDPPATVSAAAYNTWYDAHVEEILAVEGWESATRYDLDAVVNPEDTGGYRFLSLYELSCPPAVAVANLEAASMGNAEAYADKKDGDQGDLPLPDWFGAIRFGSWNAVQVGDRVVGEDLQ